MEGLSVIKLGKSTSNGIVNSLVDHREVAVKLPRVPVGFLRLRKDLMKKVVSDDHLIKVCPMKGTKRLGKQTYKLIPPITPQAVDYNAYLADGSNSEDVTNIIINAPEENVSVKNVPIELDSISQESASIQSMTSKEILAKPNQQQTLLKYKLGTAPHDKAKLIEKTVGSQYIKSIESIEQINNEKLNTDSLITPSNPTYIEGIDNDSLDVSVGGLGMPGNLHPIRASESASIFPPSVAVSGQVNLVVVPSKVSAPSSLYSDDNLGNKLYQPSIDVEVTEKKKELLIAQPDVILDFDDEVSRDSDEFQRFNRGEKQVVVDRQVKYTVKQPGTVNLDLYRLRIPSPKSSQRKSFLDADYSEPIYTPSSFRRPMSKGSRCVSPSFNTNRNPGLDGLEERFDFDQYLSETVMDVASAVENHIPPLNASRNQSRGTNNRGGESRGGESRGGVSRGGVISRDNAPDDFDSRSRGTYGSRGSEAIDMIDFMASLSVDMPPPELLERYGTTTYNDGNFPASLPPESSGELSGIEYYLSLLPQNMTAKEELGVMIGENKGGCTVQFNQIEKIIRPVHVDYPVDPVFLDGKGNVRLLDEMKYSKLKHIATTFGKDTGGNVGQLLRTKMRNDAKSALESMLHVQLQPRVVYYEAPTIKEALTPAQRTVRNLERLNEIETKEKKARELEERNRQDKLEEEMKAKVLTVTHLLTHSPNHLLTHSLTHSLKGIESTEKEEEKEEK